MDVKVTTNNHPRDLVTWWDLPEVVRSNEFGSDYITSEDCYSPRFVQYRGRWYDTSDCDGLARNIGITGWDLYQSDSFYSGIVFRWPATGETGRDGDPVYDYDSVIVGTYIGS